MIPRIRRIWKIVGRLIGIYRLILALLGVAAWFCQFAPSPNLKPLPDRFVESLFDSMRIMVGSRFSPWQHHTWTLIHANSANVSCSGSTCAATLTSTTAGNLLVFGYFGANNVTISSVSAGGTLVHCPACAAGVSGTGWIDASYVLSATGSVTTSTVTLSGSGGSWATIASEWHSSLGTAIFDTSANQSDASCTTCAAPPLTLTGSNDLVVVLAASTNTTQTSASAGFVGASPYTNPALFPNGDGWGGGLNITSYAAPNWSQNTAGVMNVAALAFKEVASGTPGAFPRIVN